MNRRGFIVGAALCAAAGLWIGGAFAATGVELKGATASGSGQMPVFTWTYYAFTNRLDDATTIANWKDLGINAPLSPRVDGTTDKDAFRTFLDRCLDAGIRPYVYDTRIADRGSIAKILGPKGEGAAAYRKLVEEVVADWGGHPAVRGFYVCDEPEAEDASSAFLAARIQREVAPHLEPFLNLLPWFDWISKRIGAKTLAEYLDRARRESGLDFLGYDCYAQQIEGYGDKNVGDYFHNLREWAEFGKRSGVRWNTTLLCVPHFHYVIKSADDFRWQISTAAAMGAKGLSWFYVDQHMGPHLNYRDAPINPFGERTQTFTWMSTEQRLFNRQFAAAFMGLSWERAYCVGKTYGGIPAWRDTTEAQPGSDAALVSVKGENMLVSFFRDVDGRRFVALVNLSRASLKDLNITFAPGVGAEILGWTGWQKLVKVYDPLQTKRSPQNVWYPLAPGQLILIRLAAPGSPTGF